MSGVGFTATGLSLGVLQSEIAGIITQLSGLETTVLTMQSIINNLSQYIEELQKKCRHLDANRNPAATDISSINSQLNIKSNCLIGTSGDGKTQVTIDRTLNTKSDVKIQGNLIVYGSIYYSVQ
jgi:prefoldin subunit 5